MKWSLKNTLSEEQSPQFIRILSLLLFSGFLGFLFVFFFSLYYEDHKLFIVIALSGSSLLIPLLLLRSRFIFASTWIFSFISIVAVTLVASIGQGKDDISLWAFPVILVFTSLTLKRRVVFINFGLILSSLAWLFLGEDLGWYTPVPDPLPAWGNLAMVSFILVILLITIDRLTANLQKNLNQAKHEVAQREQSEKEKLKLQEQLAQEQKMETIGQLAGGIAHDFNNQLAGILGYADLLTYSLEDPTLIKYARSIQAGAENGARLTQQLLSFARKGRYHLETINLNAVLDETVGILNRTIDKKIHIYQTRNVPVPTVRGDRTQIQNAVLNIALNARDAITGRGKIVFEHNMIVIDETRSHPLFHLDPGTYICMSIRDDGCGMDKTVENHIFEPFFTTKEIGKGTGMGLPSAYGVAKHHGGGIFVESITGVGTTIHFLLPFFASVIEDPVQNQEITLAVSSARILIIDDDNIIRELMSDFLRGLGYKTHGEDDGEKGLKFYKENWNQVDLVILDMVMPRKGGEETFFDIIKINPEAKIILSSGYSLEDDSISRIVSRGASFIQKPCSLNELANAVAALLCPMV